MRFWLYLSSPVLAWWIERRRGRIPGGGSMLPTQER